MTDDIKLAQQAGISFSTYQGIGGRLTTLTDGSQKIERIEAFAALIRADERERCAMECDHEASDNQESDEWRECASYLANEIRAMGEAK